MKVQSKFKKNMLKDVFVLIKKSLIEGENLSEIIEKKS